LVPSSFSLSLCPFSFVIVLSVVFYLLLLITSFVPSSFSLSFCLFSFAFVLFVVLLFTASDYLFGTFKLLFNTMTKEKGQRDEENLEGTKEVIRSRK
jgi:sensor histidine kinase YesM